MQRPLLGEEATGKSSDHHGQQVPGQQVPGRKVLLDTKCTGIDETTTSLVYTALKAAILSPGIATLWIVLSLGKREKRIEFCKVQSTSDPSKGWTVQTDNTRIENCTLALCFDTNGGITSIATQELEIAFVAGAARLRFEKRLSVWTLEHIVVAIN